MQRLKNSSHTPPDGFRYVHAETGYESKAIDEYTWIQNITAHRRANSLSEVTLTQATDQLCQSMPPGVCEQIDETKVRSWVNTRLKFGDIMRGMKAYIDLIASGFQTVSQEEANRRASICSGCYLRITPQGCGACVKLSRLITGDLAKKKTSYDSHLVNKACAVCACGVQSIVHFPMPLLEKAESTDKQALYPDFCWRKQGAENYSL